MKYLATLFLFAALALCAQAAPPCPDGKCPAVKMPALSAKSSTTTKTTLVAGAGLPRVHVLMHRLTHPFGGRLRR